MGNVLDLKNPPEAVAEDTTDVVTPVEALEVPQPDKPAPSIDELTALTLAAAAAPRAIAWEAHHPLQGPARIRQYYLLGALVVVGALVAWWQASVLVFVAVLAGAFAIAAREHWSKPISVSIGEQGVAVDGRHYPHANLASFDIHRMPDGTVELSLHTTRRLSPHLRLPLGDQNPDDVRDVLLQYVPEDRHTIPLWDYFIRKP